MDEENKTWEKFPQSVKRRVREIFEIADLRRLCEEAEQESREREVIET